MSTIVQGAPARSGMSREDRKVIFASSLGTVFEWYDFYLYGTLAANIAAKFFTALDPTAGFIFTLLAFAAGFIVRPFGALVFGRIGDMIGRKYTFLVTIVIMGASTFLVGLLPSYSTIGLAAPIILIALRLLQGLALGGEYGGAATYVAEHAPHGKRGAYTSWIQTTATLGLFLSLIVILGIKASMSDDTFKEWGWRIPFLLSALLLLASVYIRMSMAESPAFKRLKAENKQSKAPLTESFGQWRNLKIVIIALVGLTAGQAVVWYAGQFYTQFFLTQSLKVEPTTAYLLCACALVLGTPFFVVFGTLSDRIGRKPIIMAGLLLAVLTYRPLFKELTQAANPDLARAQESSQIVVTTDPEKCSFQGSPVAREVDFWTSCDIIKRTLAQNSASYSTVDAPAGTVASVKVGDKELTAFDAVRRADGHAFDPDSAKQIASFKKDVVDAMRTAGYPAKADPEKMNKVYIVAILTVLMIYVTMVYGPIAAMLVEMFPTRIRYTSMSLPYHIGNGWFGGLLPSISFAMVASNGNMYFGLWYPIGIAAMSLVVGLLFVKETKDRDIYAEDH